MSFGKLNRALFSFALILSSLLASATPALAWQSCEYKRQQLAFLKGIVEKESGAMRERIQKNIAKLEEDIRLNCPAEPRAGQQATVLAPGGFSTGASKPEIAMGDQATDTLVRPGDHEPTPLAGSGR